MLQRSIEAGENEEVVSDFGQRNPHLGTVEEIGIAVARRGGFDRTGVGTGVWLGEAEGRDLLAHRLRDQPSLLLLFVCPLQQSKAVEADVDAHDDAKERVDVFEFFASERERDVIESGPAIFFGNRQTENAEFTHFRQNFAMELTLRIPFLNVGGHFALRELAHHIPDLLLFAGQFEIHDQSPNLKTRIAGHWNVVGNTPV
ncbi:MAG: hypothetical protein R2845_01085 [Thermomicrobiales bacterium]